MELYNGRPEDTSGRKEKEIKVYDILDSLHIPYIRADHEAVMTLIKRWEWRSVRICSYVTGRKRHIICF